jgi:hypothetical protein
MCEKQVYYKEILLLAFLGYKKYTQKIPKMYILRALHCDEQSFKSEYYKVTYGIP